MAKQRPEFGKRRPMPPAPATAPVKRSGHVALLLMGTLAVGGSAYALMPRQQSCPQPGAEAPAMTGQPQTTECTSHRSGGGSGGSGRWGFSSSDSETSRASSTHVADASSAHSSSANVSRGGFGGFAHGFGFGGGG